MTIKDRVNSKVWIAKLFGKNASGLAQKTIDLLMPVNNIIHTITGDNGKEFADHHTINKELTIYFYFAPPYNSWERVANETTNGLIR